MSITKEEAITNLEKLVALFYTESEQSKMVDYSKIIETLEFAAAVLRPVTREQVAEVWKGCDLCLDDSWQRILMIPKRFDHTNMLSAELAQFCPACGRPLTDKAVDMVMERLEEVLNADTGSV